jgi:hypothetical protein
MGKNIRLDIPHAKVVNIYVFLDHLDAYIPAKVVNIQRRE